MSAELEQLRSERRADEKTLNDLRAENFHAYNVASKYDRVRCEAEDEAKVENQDRLAVEVRLKDF